MVPSDKPQAPSQPQQQQSSIFPQPVTTPLEGSQFHQNQTESGLPPLPRNPPSWTDLTSPNQTGSAPAKQDSLRRQQASQTNNTQPAMPNQAIPQQPIPIPLEPEQPQLQRPRSQSRLPSAQPAEAVLVPYTVGQVGSHVFPIGNGQYQIRVISYMEVLFPMIPCPAQPPHP